ncbi:hypothetical protein ACHAW5_007086 [Stephanodiscus triporus]|uniref:Uncharacterized protein n=1 Tax=Stephanodiscus triporus TaxID=2934178 RepID=A0ABD3N8N2_9STRA
MPVLPSPSSRRSPRSEKRGLHRNPPSKAAVAPLSRGNDAAVSGDATTATTTAATPLPSVATPGRSGGVKAIDSPKRGGASPGGHGSALLVKPWRRTATISPRTRGAAIAGVLASPGDLPLATNDDDGSSRAAGIGGRRGGNGGEGGRPAASPSGGRSSAEAALRHLARATTRTDGRSSAASSSSGADGGAAFGIDDADGPLAPSSPCRNGRRRRKAASDARDRLRDACDLDEFDDLDRLLEADLIPYNQTKAAHRGRSKERKGDTATTSHVTAESFVPKGKSDERWLRNFEKWTTMSNGGGRSTAPDERSSAAPLAPSPSSPLPKRWVNDQRAQYKTLLRGEKSPMTHDRATLLEGAGFVWEVRNRRNASADGGNVGRTSATVHAIGGGDERKGGRIGKRTTKSEPKNQSGVGPGRSIINDSPSGRKSPRKSPSTQFYHSLLGNQSEIGGRSDPTVSNDVGSSRVISDPRASSDRSSPTASRKRKRPIPSKRTSPSSQGGSLTSFPDDVVARDESDKRGERRKKKRRGRLSTSSLFALEALAEVPTTEGKVNSAGNRPAVSLSHKELEEVLSKSRKKRSRKKSGGVATKKKVRDESATSIVGSSKLVDEPPKREVGAKIKDHKGGCEASLQSPESPLRVKRLLPALMSGESVNGKIRAIADSDTTGNGAADAPCIAQLLLSCLSEDSAEKAVHLTQAGQKSTTDGVASLSPCGSSAPPSTSTSREESISRLDPSSDNGASNAQVELSTSEPKKLKNSRKKTPASNSMHPVESFAPHSTCGDMPIRKKKTKEVEQSKQQEVPVACSLQGTATKILNPETEVLNPVNTLAARGEKPLEPVGHLAKSTTWTFDESQEASFDDCSDSVTHDKENPITKILNADANEMNCVDTAVASKKASGINLSQVHADSGGRLAHSTIWTCDKCKTATFEDYFDAVAHEEECTVTKKVKQIPAHYKEGDEEPNVTRERVRSKSPLFQSTSVPNKGAVDGPSPPLFSPVSLTSPNECYHRIQGGSTVPMQSILFPSSQSAEMQSGSTIHLTKPSLTTGLVSNGVAFQNGNLQISFPEGTQISESQLHMIIAKNEYQERMTELGRLRFEAQMVTQRMHEIEEMMKLDSRTISNVGFIEGSGMSYQAESKSTSTQHHKHSWCHNDNSDKHYYSDDFPSPRKVKRQKRSPDELEQRVLSGSHSSRKLETHTKSSTAIKGRSISSRNGGTMTHLSYDDSELETRSSQQSKKAKHYRAGRTYSPIRRGNRAERLKGYVEPLVARMPLTSGSRKIKSKQIQNNQFRRSDVEKSSPRKPAFYQSDEYSREGSCPRTGPSRGKSQTRNESKSIRSPSKTIKELNVEADAKISDKASSEQSPGEAKGKDSIPVRSSQYQVNKTRDPLYWLAGGESSSDDESWDFDGPMILPPSPI